MMYQDSHVFKGMKRDTSPISQDSNYLWEGLNIKFTADEESSLLTMTNAKGTLKKLHLEGTYVGHCVVGEYLVLFTHTSDEDIIHKIDESYTDIILYRGDLQLDPEYPLQTLGIYEGEYVQKVYWVDGLNQPRVINIAKEELYTNRKIEEGAVDIEPYKYSADEFNFVRKLELNENISITRSEGSGMFSPGTIQYAFTYYNKYGQETNIFYTSGIYYISYSDRGGSPEDKVSNTFTINIDNVDANFEYLRIYSIHRTSLDVVPTVLNVVDLELSKSISYKDSVPYINYIDTGLNGSTVDPTKLLYIGGEEITANTLAQKDGTLFFGNIKLLREDLLSDVAKDCTTYKDSSKKPISTLREVNLGDYGNKNDFYGYINQLKIANTRGFKVGDIYRLGIQFQHKTGRWSTPIWIGDYTCDSDRPNVSINEDTQLLHIPEFKIKLSDLTTNVPEDYVKVRGVVVYPTIHERNIIAQGVINPTVFCTENRVNNTPFAQSSWFFRPFTNLQGKTLTELNSIKNEVNKGSILEYRHLQPLGSPSTRGGEIQNMEYQTFSQANTALYHDKTKNINTFFVDQSICTFNSPDIEFDDTVKGVIDKGDYSLDIVGIIPIKSNAGDINIETSTPAPAPNDLGFYHKTLFNTDGSGRILNSGLFYKSHIIDDTENKDGVTLKPAYPTEDDWQYSWLVFPWHRTGSLNNDCSREEGGGTRSAVLKRKVISNLRYSYDNLWLNTDIKLPITKTYLFNSNEMSLIKIESNYEDKVDTMNYYGNVDTLVTTKDKYSFFLTKSTEGDFTSPGLQELATAKSWSGDYQEQLKKGKDPVRLTYKSTPHAVFALKYIKDSKGNYLPTVLPYNTVGGIPKDNYPSKILPYWFKQEETALNINSITKTPIECKFFINSVYSNQEDAVKQILNDKTIELISSPDAPYDGDILYAIATSTNTAAYGSDAMDLYKATFRNTEEGFQGWSKVTLTSDDLGQYYYYGNTYYIINTKTSGYYLEPTEYENPSSGGSTVDESYQYNSTDLAIPTQDSYLLLAELRRKEVLPNRFGGDSTEDNLWLPAGEPVKLNEDSVIEYTFGDTYYQRYDCLKTYSYTNEDTNSVIDIASFMCETRVNIDGRYDRNRGNLNNLNVSPTNFNKFNDIYNQRNNFFNYRILDKDYYITTSYPSQVVWSLQKTYLEDIDTWTNITLANSLDLDGNKGRLNALTTFNDVLLAFQDKAFSQILFNSRVQINAADGVPIELANNYKVEGTRFISDSIGCQSRWSIATSPLGIYFIDDISKALYLYNGQLNNISDNAGMKWWFLKYSDYSDYWSIYHYYNSKILNYDLKNKELYISLFGEDIEDSSLCYSEILQCASSLSSLSNSIMFNFNDSFHSFHYSTDENTIDLYEVGTGEYNDFYDNYVMPWFTYVCNDNPANTKIFDTVEYASDCWDKDNNLLPFKTFDWIRANNEYQDSTNKKLSQLRRTTDVSLRKKFRKWRCQIPRMNRERMRNLWNFITLGFNKDTSNNNFKCVIHNISTKYTI